MSSSKSTSGSNMASPNSVGDSTDSTSMPSPSVDLSGVPGASRRDNTSKGDTEVSPIILLRRRSSVYDVADVTHDSTLTKCLKLHADVRALTGSIFTLANVAPLWRRYKSDLLLDPAVPTTGIAVGLVNELVLVSLVALRHIISTAIGNTLMGRGVPAYAAAVASEFVASCFDVVSDTTIAQLVIQRADVDDDGNITFQQCVDELNKALAFVMRRDVELKPAFAKHVDPALAQANPDTKLEDLRLVNIDVAAVLQKMSIENKVEHDRRESTARAQELEEEDELLRQAEEDRQGSVSHFDEGILEMRRRSLVEELMKSNHPA